MTKKKSKATKTEVSFNKFQRTCSSHVQELDREAGTKRCFCESTGENCRKDKCPNFMRWQDMLTEETIESIRRRGGMVD